MNDKQPDEEAIRKAKKQEAMEITEQLYQWASQQRFAIGQAAVELGILKILQRHMSKEEAQEYHGEQITKYAPARGW